MKGSDKCACCSSCHKILQYHSRRWNLGRSEFIFRSAVNSWLGVMLHFLSLLFRPKNRGSVYCICVVYDAGNVALNMLQLSVLNHLSGLTFDIVAGWVGKKQLFIVRLDDLMWSWHPRSFIRLWNTSHRLYDNSRDTRSLPEMKPFHVAPSNPVFGRSYLWPMQSRLIVT